MSRRRWDPKIDLFEEILIRYMEKGVRDRKYKDETLDLMYCSDLIEWEVDPTSGLETIRTTAIGMHFLRYNIRCRFPRVKHMIRYNGTVSRWSA